MIIAFPYNHTHITIECDRGILQEMSEYFTFTVPGAQFIPSVRAKFWDGKVRMLNLNSCQIYRGLYGYVKKFCLDRGYEFDGSRVENDIEPRNVDQFLANTNFNLTPRDYQLVALRHAALSERAVLLSPTASGKSFIIHMICGLYGDLQKLIVVPTISLVAQMCKDLQSYGMAANDIVTISSGREKINTAKVVITTWQSIYKLGSGWFAPFGVVIGDEAHLFKSKSLTAIMEKMPNCRYRFGTTGTLDGKHIHKLQLEGLFGPTFQVTTTKKLMDNGDVAALKIQAVVLQYPEASRKAVKRSSYHEEMEWLVSNPRRLDFVVKMVTKLATRGNVLVLFNYVEKHGKKLKQRLDELFPEANSYLVHGKTEVDQREEIRELVSSSSNMIICASYGVFSTGINAPNINYVVFSSPSKSKIRVLQSVGRGLRKTETKNTITLVDIADDLTIGAYVNHTYKHYLERLKIYTAEQFEYKINTVNIKE